MKDSIVEINSREIAAVGGGKTENTDFIDAISKFLGNNEGGIMWGIIGGTIVLGFLIFSGYYDEIIKVTTTNNRALGKIK